MTATKRGNLAATAVLVAAFAAVCAASQTARATIIVTSNGAMQQIYSGAGNGTTEPGTHVREHGTLWDANDPTKGIIFFTQSASSPRSIYRAETSDAGLNWTTGVDTNLANPSPASADERNPVVRDFDSDGNFTGFFGSLQGSGGGPYVPNQLLFTAASADTGASWSGESMVTFNTGAFPGHTGLNGFIEIFKTSSGNLRGYTAMNNITGSPSSATHIVESTDGGATWTDLGNILIDGKNNVIGANGPVFSFVDDDDGQTKMGWFMFGESAHRGVHLMISTDEGLSWAAHTALSFSDSSIRSGDANFISDNLVRLFYYRNTGSLPSDRQLWYEDFTLSGMSNLQPNNLYGAGSVIPEPASIVLLALGGLALLFLGRLRLRRRS